MYHNEQENNMKHDFRTTQKGCTHQKRNTSFSGGFTLIETLVAIFILTLTIGALLTLTAGGFYSVRYSRNQIVANALMQEGLEYIRNTRDGVALQESSWAVWKSDFESNGCFTTDGCRVDPYTTNGVALQACSGSCPFTTYYPDQYFYGYQGGQYPMVVTNPYETSFVRTVSMSSPAGGAGTDHVLVTVTVRWKNGLNDKSVSQSLLLTNWTQ